MHILQVSSGDFSSTYGGGQVYVKNIVDELATIPDMHITVLSFSTTHGISIKDYKGCHIYEVAETSEEDLLKLISNISPDIIHAHSHKALISRIGSSLAIPVIITAHHGGILCTAGTLLTWNDKICNVQASHKNCLKCVLRNIRSGISFYPLLRYLPTQTYYRIGHFLEKAPFIYFITPIGEASLFIKDKLEEWECIVKHSKLLIAPSEATREALIRNGLPPEKVTVLPHGIPLPQNSPAFPPIKTTIHFYYVGRICYEKGVHVLLEAFNRLSNSNARLHIIGSSGNKGERKYESMLKIKYAKDGRITWHGKIAPEQVQDTIKDFHVCISPSICLETFGLSIAEALSMRKPVIATLNGGSEMQIVEGINGWLIPPNDANEMTKKMEEIFDMGYNRLVSISNNCKSISIRSHCERLINIYKEVNDRSLA